MISLRLYLLCAPLPPNKSQIRCSYQKADLETGSRSWYGPAVYALGCSAGPSCRSPTMAELDVGRLTPSRSTLPNFLGVLHKFHVTLTNLEGYMLTPSRDSKGTRVIWAVARAAWYTQPNTPFRLCNKMWNEADVEKQ
jgi:hypothetical protein